jgi:hypothetical protein
VPPAADDYAHVLIELAARIDSGRIYDRDLPTMTPVVNALVEALWRRQKCSRSPLT